MMKLDGDKLLADLKEDADELMSKNNPQLQPVIQVLIEIQLAIYRGNYTIKD